MLEIGLGCDMKYGPGASVRLWKALLHPGDELWEAEVDKLCVDKFKAASLEGVNIVTGDQSGLWSYLNNFHKFKTVIYIITNTVSYLDVETLRSWILETKVADKQFDIIVDDGGHENHQIYNSFEVLFPDALAPGTVNLSYGPKTLARIEMLQ